MGSTIKDVARLAGVSIATVSRVINSPETVKKETRETVLTAMKESGYTYNTLARSLSTRKSLSIGLIVPSITNPIFAESTLGIQDCANNFGYTVLLGDTDYDFKKEAMLINALNERRVEGLIITTSSVSNPYLKKFKDEDFPVVLIYNTTFSEDFHFVTIDNFKSAYEIVKYLIELGHKRIGMIAGYFDISDRSYARWQGYAQCLKDHGIPQDDSLVVQESFTAPAGREAMKYFLKMSKPPTAVFCSNDFLAIGAMSAVYEKGLKIPDDISICGFDNMELSSHIYPPLTTVDQPAYEMGYRAMEILMKVMAGEVTAPQHIFLDYKLIIRNSCSTLNLFTKGRKHEEKRF